MAVPARELSHQLRETTDPDLRRRRWIAALSLVGVGAGAIVGLYQIGILKRLPDPPLHVFDSTRVDASDYAYKRMQTPDAFLMLISYSVTAALAATGARDRAETAPWLPVALAAKAAYDSAVALKLGQEEWAENRALYAYCQAATAAFLISTALAMPEAWRAVVPQR